MTPYEFKNKLIENDCHILKESVLDDGSYCVSLQNAIIVYYPDYNVCDISFQVTTPPDEAAKFTSVLKDIDKDLTINVGSVFIYVEGQLYKGEEALKLYENAKIHYIIKTYIEEQMEMHKLQFCTSYEC